MADRYEPRRRARESVTRLSAGVGRWAALALLALLSAIPCRAERWLCPDCPDEIAERPLGSAILKCPKCKASYNSVELTPPLCYANVSTRDTELVWSLDPVNCRIYKADGLETFPVPGDTLWVPWIMVDWFIPRMRLVRLTDGRELRTDYAKDRVFCPEAPKFSYEVSDSLVLPGRPPTVFKDQGEYSLAELFIVAFTPEARDSARVRFVREVETGKHPRLPRTEPRVMRLPDVVTPPEEVKPGLKAETVLEVRVHENRGIIGVHLVEGSGNAALDSHALALAQRCSFTTAGELGVPVPSWVRLRVRFDGPGGSIEVEPAPNGFWRR